MRYMAVEKKEKKGKRKKIAIQKAIETLRKMGEEPAVVERFNYYAKRYMDLWGIIDIISLSPDGHIRFIQVFNTLGEKSSHKGGFNEHYEKIQARRKIFHSLLLNPKASVELWGWRGVLPGVQLPDEIRGRERLRKIGHFNVWVWNNPGESIPARYHLFTNGVMVPIRSMLPERLREKLSDSEGVVT